ncbi:MAG TPA: sn-glycerol-3-phosphate ABC transporter ATP-binding protein UgpC, partial [Solirubrobacteraceae bacterium]|nr:sn-glycerol-3-phosphate ABC transporter ATP-binding protein UgpC [Solirubrobacteraceae bacterium]
MAEITLEELTKVYSDGTRAVTSLDLEVQNGEFVVFVGPSGCGKTTALRLLAGLEEITSGQIKIGDRVVNDLPPKDRDIAMVFQNYALYPHMTVRQNMGFALKLRGMNREEIDGRVEEAARILDLQEHLDRKPANLSGGQRQRVAMGRAIVREPAAFLMDEPLSNLDAKLRVQMRAEVSRLQNRLGVTTVYVTHDQTEALTLGHRVAVMRLGILQQFATPRELYDNPRNLFVAGFIGSPSMNFFAGRIENDTVRTPLGDLPLEDEVRRRLHRHEAASRDVIVGIRPEEFEDARFAADRDGGFVFEAPVEIVESMGSEIYAYFGYEGSDVQSEELRELEEDTGAGEVKGMAEGSRAVARLDATSDARPGQNARLWLNTRKLHLFDSKDGTSLTRQPETAAA